MARTFNISLIWLITGEGLMQAAPKAIMAALAMPELSLAGTLPSPPIRSNSPSTTLVWMRRD